LHSLALFVQTAWSNCQYLGLVELLDAALRQEDTPGSLGLSFNPLN